MQHNPEDPHYLATLKCKHGFKFTVLDRCPKVAPPPLAPPSRFKLWRERRKLERWLRRGAD